MSSTVTEENPSLQPRRLRRTQNRLLYWVLRLKRAQSGDEALTAMWSWTRGELAKIGEQRPEDAEAARWHLARELAALNASLRRARYPMRAGITDEEESGLLGRPGGGQ
jgi:hypothetical protein